MGKELLKINEARQRKRYSKEFKLNGVQLLRAGQKPATQLASELGIRRKLLFITFDLSLLAYLHTPFFSP